MSIFFQNKGEMDLDVIRTMGVSVKTGDSPIGYFGTGLKFAIATLLRTDHKVELFNGDDHYIFSARDQVIRGETFQMVYMNDEKLAFTTDLGKNWEVWMAYREIHSNCIDEGGTISRTPPEHREVVWKVSGEDIELCFDERHDIFLHGEPKWVCSGVEVYAGSSSYIYYRGVLVGTLPKRSRFTYNFTTKIDLTEDRTMKSLSDAVFKLACRLPSITDEAFQSKIITPGECFEDEMVFMYCGQPSEEFLDAAEKMIDNARLSKRVKDALFRHRKIEVRKPVQLTSVEESVLQQALADLTELNARVTRDQITVVEHLGPGIYGLMEDNRIYIPRQTLANGIDFTMITVWEEYLHRDMGLRDESRAMQQYLFDKILALVKDAPIKPRGEEVPF